MYLGCYVAKVSGGNQLTFPSKFHEASDKSFIITTWFENSLLILPSKDGGKTIANMLQNATSLLPEVRDLERFIYGNAHQVYLDTKRRFVLPKELREYASIKENAIFVGISERIEIWDKEVYQGYGEIRERQIRETALRLYKQINK